jgi:UDP-2,3-diacylglucosamine pyrophosphatase LpxH
VPAESSACQLKREELVQNSEKQAVRRRHDSADPRVDYLLLSDIHLGSDIVTHLRPWAATSWLLREAEVDQQLVSMLEHYGRERAEGRLWRLVIAGDFLDLVGVSLAPQGEHVHTKPTREEERHGLGSAADHVVHKVHAIADRHPTVFAALMRFLAAGNSLVVVRGNHDIELHWRSAQRALIDVIVQHAPLSDRAELAERIEICPWFYAVDGLLYVEHGHEFDAMCSYGDPLLPTCVRDPRRIRSTPFSVLLRHVARPTRGLSSASYGYVGMGAYVVLLLQLGLLGSLQIAVRYARACTRLVSERFVRAVDGGRRRMHRAQSHFRRFAARSGVSTARLEALREIYVAPAVQNLSLILRSLYLDRIASGLLALAALAAALTVGAYTTRTTGALCAIPALLFMLYAVIGSGSNTPPKASMQRGAERIAGLFKARWVVMGHTHEPVITEVAADSRYVNLGSWGTDDPPEEQLAVHKSSCTFLVLRKQAGEYTGELLCWDSERGPLPTNYEHTPKRTEPRAVELASGLGTRPDTQVNMPATHATRQVVSSPPSIARGPS